MVLAVTAGAQSPTAGDTTVQTGAAMTGMDHSKMHMQPQTFINNVLRHSGSGTDAEPNSTPAPMLMTATHGWTFMFHGVAWINDIQQSGPRGADKFFSTNWGMGMAQRQLGRGQFTARAMLSLEPATITGRRYPELFQVGETAYGKPIVDGQHPHDFVMELAATYDVRVGEHGLMSFYAAPVGDPALGPIAYPHRASAAENPLAPLGHHLEDSTHIASDVVTGGFTYHNVRVEASGFHGREPDEYRWNIDSGRIDSWSMRATVNPANNWSAQYSIAHLTSPEALNPLDDVRRMTASVIYNRPLRNGHWSTTLLWGRNQDLNRYQVFDGYLAESNISVTRQSVWGRVENVDRTNEILLGEQTVPAGFDEKFAARVQAYTLGYDHEIGHLEYVSAAIGGQMTLYSKPSFLTTLYGDHPLGVVGFVRFRAKGTAHH